jgi:hypothetical protein
LSPVRGDRVTVHVPCGWPGIPDGSVAIIQQCCEDEGTVGLVYAEYPQVGELFTSVKNVRPLASERAERTRSAAPEGFDASTIAGEAQPPATVQTSPPAEARESRGAISNERPRKCGGAGCEECYGRSSAACESLSRQLASWARTQSANATSPSVEIRRETLEECARLCEAWRDEHRGGDTKVGLPPSWGEYPETILAAKIRGLR